jgi:hypothetical protein
MLVVLIGMFVAVAIGVAVVAAVALPARREGRDLLTPEGEETLKAMRDKVADVIPGLPTGAH